MSSTEDDIEKFLCAVCQDVLEDPRVTSCGHSFCLTCLETSLRAIAGRCPVCRSSVASVGPRDAKMAEELSSTTAACRNTGCTERVRLSRLRAHESTCPHRESAPAIPSGTLRLPPGVAPPPPGPNRSTFGCPYCDQKNLTSKDLVDHVRSQHSRIPPARRRVVCPICASMPWGDGSLRSADFNVHLENRHKFDYHEYVDMAEAEDDDAVLRQVLEKSMEDH